MEKFEFIKEKEINQLPKTPGVYCFWQNGKIVYIGKAISIQNRVKNHFNGKAVWEKTLENFKGKIGFIKTNSEIEALILEAGLIKKFQPKFNVMWRDDKNYFYVCIAQTPRHSSGQANQKIPYIHITHQPFGNTQGKPKYVGPFVEGNALKKTLRFLRRVFPYYTSSTHPKIKCTWCHLDLCPGPFLDLPAYKKNIKKLILILQGKRNAVLNLLRKEMENLSKENKFEEAARLRDRIYNLQQVMSHTRVIESAMNGQQGLPKSQNAPAILSGIINSESAKRIECYDISNIQGKFATGSMVVFTNGVPDKSQYKKFKINLGNKPNDIAMLKEVLARRFLHKEWPKPDVILIDGGKAQLNIAIKNKNPGVKAISLAKGRQELFIEGFTNPIPLNKLPQKVKNLILLLDDQAHRFAITYHKKLRKKGLLQ